MKKIGLESICNAKQKYLFKNTLGNFLWVVTVSRVSADIFVPILNLKG
jgi:hypothetical protein